MAFPTASGRGVYQGRRTRFLPPVLVTSGTLAQWVDPAQVARVHLVVCGGGGAGGGSQGGGGGSGAVGAFVLDMAKIAEGPNARAYRSERRRLLNITAIGAGGAGVVDNTGGNGGSTTVELWPFTVTASGGLGGRNSGANSNGGDGGALSQGNGQIFMLETGRFAFSVGYAIPLVGSLLSTSSQQTEPKLAYGSTPAGGINTSPGDSAGRGGAVLGHMNGAGGGRGGAGPTAAGNCSAMTLPQWADFLLGATWTGDAGAAGGVTGGGAGCIGNGGAGGTFGGSNGTGYGSGGGGGGVGYGGGSGAPGFVAFMFEIWD